MPPDATPFLDGLRMLLAAAGGAGVALAVERAGTRRGLGPPWGGAPERRAAAVALLALVLFFVFLGLAFVDRVAEAPVETPRPGELFALQGLLVAVLVAWYALGWGRGGWRRAARELGLRARRPFEEISLGIGIGLPAWAVALGATAATAAAWQAAGGAVPSLDDAATERVAAVAALSVGLRMAISVSAGLVEEIFFRGFLQRRLGIGGATALFVIAHVGYGQVFLLVGVTVLSVIFGLLVRWRGNVWAAVVAHFLFDAVQLLVVIPRVMAAGPDGLG